MCDKNSYNTHTTKSKKGIFRMKIKERINAFGRLGEKFNELHALKTEEFETLCKMSYLRNNWFTQENIDHALLAWSRELNDASINHWLSGYEMDGPTTTKSIGVINAGNIPMVGFHDMLSVLISGHRYIGKNASDDNLLLPFVTSLLTEIEPGFTDRISFVEKLTKFDAVIATGNNNSARYFENYFGKVPHIIRKNRSGVGVVSGNETPDDFRNLGVDIFQYYGMGCRNISKIYVPDNYDFKNFFEGVYHYNDVMQHSKYMNNFDYNNAMLLMKQIPFLTNEFLIIHEDERITSPIAVVHYEKYAGKKELNDKLDAGEEMIQCVVAIEKPELKSQLKNRIVKFGEAQSPALNDYADGVDTIRFLLSV